MVSTTTTAYWLFASDGGVFCSRAVLGKRWRQALSDFVADAAWDDAGGYCWSEQRSGLHLRRHELPGRRK